MKLKSVDLNCFQIHKKLHIDFSPGFNVLVGESASGKSAVLRAIEWVAKNRPVGADKIFQQKGTKTPISVVLLDDHGNTITRNKKNYVVNSSELNALNKTLPKIVEELIPLKAINLQSQLDPHFLILEKHSAAAKIVHQAIGMEDQEIILKEIKARMSIKKSEIKNIVGSIAEAKTKISELQGITRHLKKAKVIKEGKQELLSLSQEVSQLKSILHNMECLGKPMDISVVSVNIKEIDRLIKIVYELDSEEKQILALQELLENINSYTEVTYNVTPFINNVSKLILKLRNIDAEESELKNLEYLLNNINSVDKELRIISKSVKEKQQEYDSVLKTFKVCPFCNRKM